MKEIIKYVDLAIEKDNVSNNGNLKSLRDEERKNITNNLKLDLSASYEHIKQLYYSIGDLIQNNPRRGIYLIEVHYRLANVKFTYEEDETMNNIIIHYMNILGYDFETLFNESIESYSKLSLNFLPKKPYFT